MNIPELVGAFSPDEVRELAVALPDAVLAREFDRRQANNPSFVLQKHLAAILPTDLLVAEVLKRDDLPSAGPLLFNICAKNRSEASGKTTKLPETSDGWRMRLYLSQTVFEQTSKLQNLAREGRNSDIYDASVQGGLTRRDVADFTHIEPARVQQIISVVREQRETPGPSSAI